jgi:protein PhnA
MMVLVPIVNSLLCGDCAIEFRCAVWLPSSFMKKPACPMCEMTDILDHSEKWECLTCGHEWERAAAPEAAATPRVVKDAHGNVLAEGDCVILIKDLKLGGSQVLKGGSKSKPIRLVDGDHEIDCKVDGIAVCLKACFVKKA